jgi:hypothetical protein
VRGLAAGPLKRRNFARQVRLTAEHAARRLCAIRVELRLELSLHVLQRINEMNTGVMVDVRRCRCQCAAGHAVRCLLTMWVKLHLRVRLDFCSCDGVLDAVHAHIRCS